MTSAPGIAPPGYRLPASAHIGRVRLKVAELDRSLGYYEKVLGLRVIERSPGVSVLGAHGDDTPLLELIEQPGAKPVPRRGLLGLYHFAVLMPDRASLGRFLAHLLGLGIHAGMSDHLVSEAVYLTDPDGLGIEVYADRPRESWKLANGQIEMTTKPLDAVSVMESAAGERWNGAPPGTRIGHVHFHVGDIDEAASFYHSALGLDKIVWGYPGALFLSAGGYHHHVGVNTWAAGSPPASDQDARLVDWELVLPDPTSASQTAGNIENAGFVVDRSGDVPTAADPWGIRVRLVAA